MSSTSTAAEIRSQLLGAWKLVSWQQIDEDGSVAYPLGDHAIGQLMYTDSGHVCAQLVRVGQPRFASDDWQQATVDEMGAAWRGYFGYFGTFSVYIDAGALIHHMEAGWFPNLPETEQVRRFRFQDGLLVLDAETAWGGGAYHLGACAGSVNDLTGCATAAARGHKSARHRS